ncbi:uncharacterized protein BKA78DRAFT_320473 [Phyllosticta capitalensis]|uniref:uncharacterized protein n=1 Tax=Phyllosticta capitalensis TaxID=121624 RepID=UPI00312D36D9
MKTSLIAIIMMCNSLAHPFHYSTPTHYEKVMKQCGWRKKEGQEPSVPQSKNPPNHHNTKWDPAKRTLSHLERVMKLTLQTLQLGARPRPDRQHAVDEAQAHLYDEISVPHLLAFSA